jgi:hypothetical protein
VAKRHLDRDLKGQAVDCGATLFLTMIDAADC